MSVIWDQSAFHHAYDMLLDAAHEGMAKCIKVADKLTLDALDQCYRQAMRDANYNSTAGNPIDTFEIVKRAIDTIRNARKGV